MTMLKRSSFWAQMSLWQFVSGTILLFVGAVPWLSYPLAIVFLVCFFAVRQGGGAKAVAAGPLAVTAPKELTGEDKDWLELVNGWAGLRTLEVDPVAEPEPEPEPAKTYRSSVSSTGKIVREYTDRAIREVTARDAPTKRASHGEDWYAEQWAKGKYKGVKKPDGSVVVEVNPAHFVLVSAAAALTAKARVEADRAPCYNGTHAYSMQSPDCLWCEEPIGGHVHEEVYGSCTCVTCGKTRPTRDWIGDRVVTPWTAGCDCVADR